MQIMIDKNNNEYGLLRIKNAGEWFMQTANKLAEAQSEMTPDHIFYAGPEGMEKMTEKDIPKEMKNMKMPVIEFFDNEKKVYDCVVYSSVNEKRFEFVKKIKNLNEFFCFKRNKDKEVS